MEITFDVKQISDEICSREVWVTNLLKYVPSVAAVSIERWLDLKLLVSAYVYVDCIK